MALRSGGGGNVTAALATAGVVQSNLDAEADPTVNDDTTLGYAAGSYWVNVTTGVEFYCHSATDGAAVWQPRYQRPPIRSAKLIRPANMIDGSLSTISVIRSYVPILVEYERAATAWGIYLGTTQAATEVKSALYDLAADGGPGTKLSDMSAIDCSSGGTALKTIAWAYTWPRVGLYWVGTQCNIVGTTTATFLRLGSNVLPGYIHPTAAEIATNTGNARYYTSAEAYASAFADNPTIAASFGSAAIIPHILVA
jgi:hypothetical protein